MDMHIQTQLIQETEKYCGSWGINHVRRVLQLIDLIHTTEPINTDVIWLAAHLHDWGRISRGVNLALIMLKPQTKQLRKF